MNTPACLTSSRQNAIKTFLKDWCGAKKPQNGMIELVELFLSIKQSHPQIRREDNIFYPAAKMQSLTRNYEVIRDACCVMLHCASAEAGRCDKIINWTQAFNDLFIDLAQQRIAWEKKQRNRRDAADKISFQFFPGAWPQQYKKTENSNRFYHPAQNLSRSDKSIFYQGCIDFDMVAAFPSIFCKVVMKNGETHPMLDLCLKDPDHFLQLIIDHDAFSWDVRNSEDGDRDKAKAMRSMLFHPPKNGRPQKVGVKWYDDLRAFIANKLNEVVGDTAHLFYTAVEQQVMEIAFDVVGWNKICLRMHDGFIAWGIESPGDIVDALEDATGYKWHAKII